MSDILNIYASIAGMDITGVNIRDIGDIKLAVTQGGLPMRMLLPSTQGDMSFIAIGSLQNLTWVIRDLCLWAPLSAGGGIEHYSEDMVGYISSYIAKVKANRNPTSYSNITGIAIQMGPVPWGAEDYWAVDITVTVEEII